MTTQQTYKQTQEELKALKKNTDVPYSKLYYSIIKNKKDQEVKKLKAILNKYSYLTKEETDQRLEVNKLVETLLAYDNVLDFKKYATNTCMFGFSEETKECCEGTFKQTLRHYSIHGNCCQSCSNYFSARVRDLTGR